MKDNKGKYVWPNKSYYDGMWYEDKMSGFGEFCWTNGRSYIG